MPVRLTPKTLYLTVSHQNIHANLVVYEPANAGFFVCELYDVANTCAIKNWVHGACHQIILANCLGVFAVLFAINTWFNILVVATYFAICLTPKIFHLSVSHRKFLANYGVYEGIGGIGPFREKILRLYNFCTHNVAAGIRCDESNNDVLPQKVSHVNILAKMATNLLFRTSQPAAYLPIRFGCSLLPKRRYSSILAKNFS